jgi:hypothetical protein
MSDKAKAAMKQIIETINEAARTLDVRDYQIVLDEISGELEMRIDAIIKEHGLV